MGISHSILPTVLTPLGKEVLGLIDKDIRGECFILFQLDQSTN
jgi:hypothetical protein